MRASRRLGLLGAMTALLLGGSGLAFADQVSNNLDGTVDATAEVMPLQAAGPNGTTTLAVNPANGDGKNGCNLAGSTPLNVAVGTSASSVATVSPSSITFTSCGETPTLTVTPVGEGSATISLSQVSNTTGATFDLSTATFTVNVTAPAATNTPPTVSVTGVTNGGSYDVGAVPTAGCSVVDAEDGNSTPSPTLSAITGPYAVDGIGQQTATCRYTDLGGLYAESSATYTIGDPSAPVIGYTLSPSSPDGNSGWYTGTVTLTWTVTEPQSPSSLVTTGCDPVTVSADQLATGYTCSASSAGGTATPQTVTIKRDGNGPTVAYDQVVSGTVGTNGWYTSDVTVRFTDTDLFSGVVDGAKTVSSNGQEGSSVVLSSPAFSDVAGNTTAAGAASSPALKIDESAPHDVSFSGGPADNGTYYYGSVPSAPTCTATDDVSGLAGCAVTGDADPTAIGTHHWTATATDNAGNQATASLTYQVLAWTDGGFFAPVNMGGTLNTVKAGSTVPLKFTVFAGPTELTSTTVVKSFAARQVSCATLDAASDPVEVTSTGGTSLRYDTTAHQFVQNWKTPSSAGACYVVTMTTQDGSQLAANFRLK
jgi:hypothetical protein